jgi:hypothetical protein
MIHGFNFFCDGFDFDKLIISTLAISLMMQARKIICLYWVFGTFSIRGITPWNILSPSVFLVKMSEETIFLFL